MKCCIDESDVHKCFEFAVKYFLDPSKGNTARTTGVTRGLGEVIDAFLMGKLAEIAVVKMLERTNNKKQYVLNFDILPTNEVKNEPDIIKIKDNNKERKPNLFIEIKRASPNDRWIGVTQEQFDTMIKAAGTPDKIFIVTADIKIEDKANRKANDFLGAYLKKTTKLKIFDLFGDFNKSYAEIVNIIKGDDLLKYGRTFTKGELFYETNIFTPASDQLKRKISGEKNSLKTISELTDTEIPPFKPTQSIKIDNRERKYPIPEFFYPIKLTGKIKIHQKKNAKSTRQYIEAVTDAEAESEVLGKLYLKKGEIYNYNIQTIGRNPVLARNNIGIAKSKLNTLINNGDIEKPEKLLKIIADNI